MSLLTKTGVPHVHLLDAGLIAMPEYTGVYLLDTDTPAIVETGFSYSVPRILDGLEELNISPEDVKYIIPTHIHMDHAGGAGGLAQMCPNAKVLVHESVANYLVDPSDLVKSVKRAVGDLFERYGEMVPIKKNRLLKVDGGEKFQLQDDFTLRIVYAPGHAPHQFCVFVPEHHALFTADACGIFLKEIGHLSVTTPPPAFRLGAALETLGNLDALDPKILLYTHYGAYKSGTRLDDYADLLMKWVTDIEKLYNTTDDFEGIRQHFIKKYYADFEGHYDAVMAKEEIGMNVTGVLLYLKRRRGR